MYPTCLHFSALLLFLFIPLLASIKVVHVQLNNAFQSVLPLPDVILAFTFRNSIPRISFNRPLVITTVSSEQYFQSWEKSNVSEGYVETVRRLARRYKIMFSSKLRTRSYICADELP